MNLGWLKVPLSNYYIQSKETSVGQFKKCVEAGVCKEDTFKQCERCTYNLGNDNLPMSYVNYYGAEQFCDWIGGHICTEHEWNNACGGIERTVFPYGNEFKEDACNLGVDRIPVALEEVGSRPECVGSVDGLYDMGGSVGEWIDNGKEGDYGKFKSISVQMNPPIDKPVCTGFCAGNSKSYMPPTIGIRCCRKD